MKPVKKEIIDNKPFRPKVIITVQKNYLFGLIKKKVRYSSDHVIISNYRKWVKEPNKIIVSDRLSNQLDEWNLQLDPED